VSTDQHIAEALSRDYVRAIAGRAGLADIAANYPRIFAHLNSERQNGRMVMTPEGLSKNPQSQQLQVAAVVHYLQQNRWTALNHPNPRLLVFEKGIDVQAITLPIMDQAIV
jgi:hypothetical protein